MYIGDCQDHRVRKMTVESSSTLDIISTIAGTGDTTYGGDTGVAASATLYNPYGVSLDDSGKIL